MKHIKSYKIFEGWEESTFKEYEKKLGINVYDLIIDNLENFEDRKWLAEQLYDYKVMLENRKMKNAKDLLYDKAEAVIQIIKDFLDSGGYTIKNFKNLNDLVTRANNFGRIEDDRYANLVYQNHKWVIFTAENTSKDDFVPHKKRGNSIKYPWKELDHNIDHYPFDADKNTFLFFINKGDVKKSLLLRASFRERYVLLGYGDDELKETATLDEMKDVLKKHIKVQSIVDRVIEWAKENVEFPKYDDLNAATESAYDWFANDEYEYLLRYFNKDTLLKAFDKEACAKAVRNIIINFNAFNLNKSLYYVIKCFIDFDDLILKKNVMNFLSDRVHSLNLARDLKLNIKLDPKDSENNRYEEIFKHIDDDQLKDLILKYSTMEDFGNAMVGNIEGIDVPPNPKEHWNKSTVVIDSSDLEEILQYLWGDDWFKAMDEQLAETEKNKYNTETTALRLVFEDTAEEYELASEIVNTILDDQEILDMAEERESDYWSEISV